MPMSKICGGVVLEDGFLRLELSVISGIFGFRGLGGMVGGLRMLGGLGLFG